MKSIRDTQGKGYSSGDGIAAHADETFKSEDCLAPYAGCGFLDNENCSPEELLEARAANQAKRERFFVWQQESTSRPVAVGDSHSIPSELIGHDKLYHYERYRFFLFRDVLHAANGPYTEEELKLVVFQEADSERRFFEKLAVLNDGPQADAVKQQRKSIPEAVRIAVWRRDSGCCARCQGRQKLEYDHIIPVARGGSDTVRNIELLCERCNRFKESNIR